jgi:CheY-like chemotaxis protein
MFKKDTLKIPRHDVLVVDDEEGVRQLIVALLSIRGHQCLQAVDGADALNKAVTNKFDAVVTDVVMPKMDGITLTKELVKLFPDLPIMIITGQKGEYTAESAIAAGAQEFIKKPFSLPEFILRFNKMMHEHESLCKIREKRDEMIFNLHRESSGKIEELKKKIETLERKSYHLEPDLWR